MEFEEIVTRITEPLWNRRFTIIPSVALGRDERFKKRKQRKKGKLHMKGTLITVACVALASLAFGQARTDSNTNAGPTATVSNFIPGIRRRPSASAVRK